MVYYWKVGSNCMCCLSGVSGKMSTESAGDDDNFGTDSQQGVSSSFILIKYLCYFLFYYVNFRND